MSGGIEGVRAHGISCLQAGQGLNVKSALGRGEWRTILKALRQMRNRHE